MSDLAPCPFDAAAFGFPWFRVEGAVADLPAALAALPPPPWAVDAKVAAEDEAGAAALTTLGFVPVCTQVTLERALEAPLKIPAGLSLDDRLKLNRATLERHARGFRFDRFSCDTRLPETGKVALYTAWLANSLDGRMRVAHGPGGVATWNPKRGAIDLVSVLEPGHGLGRRLVEAVAADAQSHGSRSLTVTTETGNARALALYARCGFLPLRRTVVLHLVRP